MFCKKLQQPELCGGTHEEVVHTSCVSSTELGESPKLGHSWMEAGHDVGKTPEVQPELFGGFH